MPKYRVFTTEVTFYRAIVEADSEKDLEEMFEDDLSDDIEFEEYDSEAMQLNQYELEEN